MPAREGFYTRDSYRERDRYAVPLFQGGNVPIYDADLNRGQFSLYRALGRALQAAVGDGAVGDAYLIAPLAPPAGYGFRVTGGYDAVTGPLRAFVGPLSPDLFATEAFASGVETAPVVGHIGTPTCRLYDRSLPSGWYQWLGTIGSTLVPDVGTPGVSYPIVGEGVDYVEVGALIDLNDDTEANRPYRIIPAVPGAARTDAIILDVWLDEVTLDEDPSVGHSAYVVPGGGAGANWLKVRSCVWVIPGLAAKGITLPLTDPQVLVDAIYTQFATPAGDVVDLDGNVHFYFVLATVAWNGVATNLGAAGTTLTDLRIPALKLSDVLDQFILKAGDTAIAPGAALVFAAGGKIQGTDPAGVVEFSAQGLESLARRHFKVSGFGAVPVAEGHLLDESNSPVADDLVHDSRYPRRWEVLKLGPSLLANPRFRQRSALPIDSTELPLLTEEDLFEELLAWVSDLPRALEVHPRGVAHQRVPARGEGETLPSATQGEDVVSPETIDRLGVRVTVDSCCGEVAAGLGDWATVGDLVYLSQVVEVPCGGFYVFSCVAMVAALAEDGVAVRHYLVVREWAQGMYLGEKRVELVAAAGEDPPILAPTTVAVDEVLVASYVRPFTDVADPRGEFRIPLRAGAVASSVRLYVDAGAGEVEYSRRAEWREGSVGSPESVFVVRGSCGALQLALAPNHTIYTLLSDVITDYGDGSPQAVQADALFDAGVAAVFVNLAGQVCRAFAGASSADLWGKQPENGAELRVTYDVLVPAASYLEGLWEAWPTTDRVEVRVALERVRDAGGEEPEWVRDLCPPVAEVCAHVAFPALRRVGERGGGSLADGDYSGTPSRLPGAESGPASEDLEAQLVTLVPQPWGEGSPRTYVGAIDPQLRPARALLRLPQQAVGVLGVMAGVTLTSEVPLQAVRGVAVDDALTVLGLSLYDSKQPAYGLRARARVGEYLPQAWAGTAVDGRPTRENVAGDIRARFILQPTEVSMFLLVEFGGISGSPTPPTEVDFTVGAVPQVGLTYHLTPDSFAGLATPYRLGLRMTLFDSAGVASDPVRTVLTITSAQSGAARNLFVALTDFRKTPHATFDPTRVVAIELFFFHIGNVRIGAVALSDFPVQLDVSRVGHADGGSFALDSETFSSFTSTAELRAKVTGLARRTAVDVGRIQGVRQRPARPLGVLYPFNAPARVKFWGDAEVESGGAVLAKGSEAGGVLGEAFGQDVEKGYLVLDVELDPSECPSAVLDLLTLAAPRGCVLPALTAGYVIPPNNVDCPLLGSTQGQGAMIPALLALVPPDDGHGSTPGTAYGETCYLEVVIPTRWPVPAGSPALPSLFQAYLLVEDGAMRIRFGSDSPVVQLPATPLPTLYHFGGGRSDPLLPTTGGGTEVPAVVSGQPVYARWCHGPGSAVVGSAREVFLTANAVINPTDTSHVFSVGVLTGKEFRVGMQVWITNRLDNRSAVASSRPVSLSACQTIARGGRELLWYEDPFAVETAAEVNASVDPLLFGAVGLYGVISAISATTITVQFGLSVPAPGVTFYLDHEAILMASPPGAMGCYVELSRGAMENVAWALGGVTCFDVFSHPGVDFLELRVLDDLPQRDGLDLSTPFASPAWWAFKDTGTGTTVYRQHDPLSDPPLRVKYNPSLTRLEDVNGVPLLLDPDDPASCILIPRTAVCVSIAPTGQVYYRTSLSGVDVLVGQILLSTFTNEGALTSTIIGGTTYKADPGTGGRSTEAPGSDWPRFGFIALASVRDGSDGLSYPVAGEVSGRPAVSRVSPCPEGPAAVLAGSASRFALPAGFGDVLDPDEWLGDPWSSHLDEFYLATDLAPGDVQADVYGALILREGDPVIILDDDCPEGYLTWVEHVDRGPSFLDARGIPLTARTVTFGTAIPDPSADPSSAPAGCPGFTGFACASNARIRPLLSRVTALLHPACLPLRDFRYRPPINNDTPAPATLFGQWAAPSCPSEYALHHPDVSEMSDHFQVGLALTADGWVELVLDPQPYWLTCPTVPESESRVFRAVGVLRSGGASEPSQGAKVSVP